MLLFFLLQTGEAEWIAQGHTANNTCRSKNLIVNNQLPRALTPELDTVLTTVPLK